MEIVLTIIFLQVYGDTSFKDCRRASEEAIETIIKNLQVHLLGLVIYISLNQIVICVLFINLINNELVPSFFLVISLNFLM